jgi:hypothetical protein
VDHLRRGQALGGVGDPLEPFEDRGRPLTRERVEPTIGLA